MEPLSRINLWKRKFLQISVNTFRPCMKKLGLAFIVQPLMENEGYFIPFSNILLGAPRLETHCTGTAALVEVKDGFRVQLACIVMLALCKNKFFVFFVGTGNERTVKNVSHFTRSSKKNSLHGDCWLAGLMLPFII